MELFRVVTITNVNYSTFCATDSHVTCYFAFDN